MFLDAEGRKLLPYPGPRTIRGFEAGLEEVQEFLALEEQAGAGDHKAAAELLIRQLRLEWFEFEEASKRADALEQVSSSQRKELDQLLADTEVRSLVAAAGKDRTLCLEAGKHFLGMWNAKRVPATDRERSAFWNLMADYAEHEGDKKLFKKIIGELDDALPNSAEKHEILEAMEKRLENVSKKQQ